MFTLLVLPLEKYKSNLSNKSSFILKNGYTLIVYSFYEYFLVYNHEGENLILIKSTFFKDDRD